MIGMKAMIRDQQHRSIWSSQIQKCLQHHVVKTIGSIYDIFVDFELIFRNSFHARWMEIHESVTEVVDAVVIDRQEVPRFVLQDPGGSVMDGAILRQYLRKGMQSLVFLLIHFSGTRDPGKNRRFGHLRGMHAWPPRAGRAFLAA